MMPDNPTNKIRILIVVGIALCGLFLLYYFIYLRPYETTDDAFLETRVLAVAPYVSGHVKKVYVADNEVVKAGTLLVELDDSDYKSQVSLNEAQYQQALANKEKLSSDLLRYQNLIAKHEISQQVFEQAQTDLKIAIAHLKASEAALELAKSNLAATQIMAPWAGQVTRRSVENGAYVQVGQPLLALVDQNFWVVANFKEGQLTFMRPGQKVYIDIDLYTGHEFAAHVDSIQSGSGARFSLFPPENASGNFVKVVQRVPVKIVFDENLDHYPSLGPGLSVTAKVRVR